MVDIILVYKKEGTLQRINYRPAILLPSLPEGVSKDGLYSNWRIYWASL